jgi:hypothetical protein
MASWLDLERAAPHITLAGRALLNQARVALLGTIRPDGSPRSARSSRTSRTAS